MSKRFTDTDKYKKPFIRGLQGAYKLLWDYLYHDCNHAGIWIVDFDIAQIYIGTDMLVNKEDALKYFNEDEIRVVEFAKSKKWLIIPFIKFQYGTLSESNRVHRSVITALEEYDLLSVIKGLTRPLQGCKDKEKDKDKDKDKDKEESFSKFWNIYNKKVDPSRCMGYWSGSKKIKDGCKINDIDRIAIMKVVSAYVRSTPEKKYRKDPASWLYKRAWKDEIIDPDKEPTFYP